MNIEVNGINMHYTDEGEGEVVLILHGWGAPCESYRSIIDVLNKKMRVIAPDMPGVGGTKEPPCAWCVDDYTNLVTAFINALGIKKLSIIGHSFGGREIIKLMSRENLPFTVDKLVLMDAAGIRPKLSLKKRIRQRIYKISKWWLSIGIVRWFYPDALGSLAARYGSSDYSSASPVMRATLVRCINEDLTSLLPNINVPTLLIWGTEDTATPYSDAVTMNKLIKDSGIVKLQGAGHFAYLEKPAVVAAVLRSYFGIQEAENGHCA